jgi:GDP-L-fucose synthase
LKKKIFIAGQEGMVGSAVYRLLSSSKNLKIISCRRKDLDFTNKVKVEKWFKKNKPEIVINCAGRVGGIMDNSKYKSDYLYINTIIGLNIVNSCLKFNVKKLINLGSACIYPKKTKQPIKEEYLLNSNLEETNEGYAIAKIAVLKYCEYLKEKHNKNFISLQPANLYGEGDNFDLQSSHVIPALIKKFHYAKINKKNIVEVWGSGNVKREFLNVDDLALGIKFCINKKIKYSYLNIGSGVDISIKNLAVMIKKITKYDGKIIFNKAYPDGVKIRKLECKKINILGWKPKILLKDGLTKYYDYFRQLESKKNNF